MSKVRKKTVVISISVILAAAVVGVGIWAVFQSSKKAVKVAPVANMSSGGWYSSSEVSDYGNVTTNLNQDIYYDESLVVTDVYVKAGDTVKIGDPLIAYDMTLPTLELEMKQMQIEGIGLNIQNVRAELNQLRSTAVVASAGQERQDETAAPGTSGQRQANVGQQGQSGEWKSVVAAQQGRRILTTEETETETGQTQPDAGNEGDQSGSVPEEGDTQTPSGTENQGDQTEPGGEGGGTDTPGSGDSVPASKIGRPFPEELKGKPIYDSIKEGTEPYNLEEADGTPEKPYRFLCSAPGTSVDAAFLLKVLQDKIVCAFDVADDAKEPTVLLYTWILDGSTGQIVIPEEPEEPEEPQEPEEPEEPTEPEEPADSGMTYDPGIDEPLPSGGMTKEELQKQIQEKEQELKDLDLEKRTAELELKKLQKKVDNGIVTSTVEGTVKSVVDEETARLENTPMISVVGEEGFYVTGSVAETALDQIKPGMTGMVTSWETGMTYEATVTSVSSTPISGSYYSSNENMSYYPFTLVIKGDADLSNGQGVNLSIMDLSGDPSGEIYLSQMFVREEGNQYYVYKKGENDRLVKQYVEVGRNVYSELEILSGLTMEDEIAFPYGKDVKEGAKTESTDSLYDTY